MVTGRKVKGALVTVAISIATFGSFTAGTMVAPVAAGASGTTSSTSPGGKYCKKALLGHKITYKGRTYVCTKKVVTTQRWKKA
jgi:hypothetical protein